MMFSKFLRSIVLMTTLIAPLASFAQSQNGQYHFQLSASPGPYPTIRGLTDLPDGTKLMVTVLKPHLPDAKQRMASGLPACEDVCGPAQTRLKPYVDPVIKNGIFVAGPFSFGDQPLKSDLYPVRIVIVPQDITDASLAAMRPIYIGEIRLPGDNEDIQIPVTENHEPSVGRPESWQSVQLPPNLDGTMYAYDKNSISFTRTALGDISGADMIVRVVRGDESIVGKQAVFTFLCDGTGRFRVNHSYPMSLPSGFPTQEEQLANIACGVVHCELSKQQNGGASVCSRN
jgi:hypothetical protein